MYYYKVDCWVPPRSGFDIARKNQVFSFIESIADKLSDGKGDTIRSYLKEFREQSDGYVLRTFTLESDTPVIDPEKEFMGEIRKEVPEARMSNWELLDAPVVKRPL